MKLRWRIALWHEEDKYPCVDLGRRFQDVAYAFVLEQLDDDGVWRLVEIEWNPETKT